MENLDDTHHVVRYVKSSQLIKDEDENAIAIFPNAFELRDNEDYLSTAWREHYCGTKLEQLRKIRVETTLKMRPAAALASLNVGAIHEACRTCGHKVRIIYEPVEGIPAHSSIRQFPREDASLRALLAVLASADFVQIRDL